MPLNHNMQLTSVCSGHAKRIKLFQDHLEGRMQMLSEHNLKIQQQLGHIKSLFVIAY